MNTLAHPGRDTALSPAQKRFLLAFTLAILLRLYPVYLTGRVIHDGGLFYRFTQDILENGWRLPFYTSYNHSGIPFAYPPLSFYLLGVLHKISGISVFTLIGWVPPILSCISVFAFALFSRQLLSNDNAASWATLLYAFAPQSIGAQIIGGGLPRALGATLALIFLANYLKLIHKPDNQNPVPVGILAGLLITTHPEWTLHAVIAGFVLWLTSSNRIRLIFPSILVALVAAIVSAPWWGTVILRHGLAPFQGVLLAKSTYHVKSTLIVATFTGEAIPVLLALTLWGMIIALKNKQWKVAALPPAGLFLEPRSFVRTSPMYMAPAGGIALNWLWGKSAWYRLLAIILSIAIFANAAIIGIRLANYHSLSQNDLQAIHWLNENTSSGQNILIFTPQTLEVSPVAEWLPAFTPLNSLITPQGSEWQPETRWHYASRLAWGQTLRPCFQSDTICLNNWAAANQIDFNLIYITTAFSDFKTASEQPHYRAIASSPEWQLLYANRRVHIYQRAP